MNSKQLSKEEIHMANKCLIFSTLLAFKEILVKTSLKAHLVLLGTPIIKRWKKESQQILARKWGKKNSCTLLVGIQASIASHYRNQDSNFSNN